MNRECRVFLVGEGPSDIGDLARLPAYRGHREGFLQPILRELVGRPLCFDGQTLTALPKDGVSEPKKLHTRSAAQAYALAAARGCHALVFVCDVDRQPATKRSRREMKKRMDELRSSVEAGFAAARIESRRELETAIATPCRMIEAWALADTRALERVSGRCLPDAPEQPEELWGDARDRSSRHPKCVLARMLGGAPDFEQLASEVDVKTLEARCPSSFAPFASEVRRAARRCGGREPDGPTPRSAGGGRNEAAEPLLAGPRAKRIGRRSR